MKRSRFTDEQVIGALKEHEAGATVADICRRHGVSESTYYFWKKKFCGMEVNEAKRHCDLEAENAKEKLLADQMLDNAAMKELLSKNW